jgi:hypothetical protein
MLLLRLRCGDHELLTCPTKALDGGIARWNEEFVFDADFRQENAALQIEVWMWGDGTGPGETGCPGPAGSEQIGEGAVEGSELRKPADATGPVLGAPLRLFVPRSRHPQANVRLTDKRVHVQTEESAGQIRLLTAYVSDGAKYEF